MKVEQIRKISIDKRDLIDLLLANMDNVDETVSQMIYRLFKDGSRDNITTYTKRLKPIDFIKD